MKHNFMMLMLIFLAACNSSTKSSSVVSGGGLAQAIGGQEYCTLSFFDTDVSSTFSSFNGSSGSFVLNVGGDDIATISGSLSGDVFDISSGSLTFMGMTADITGGELAFDSQGESALGEMTIDLGGEALDVSLKLSKGACDLPVLTYVTPLPAGLITHNYMSLNNIQSISKFRSGAGHDFADEFESCRSMKHYYNFDGALGAAARASEPLYAPFDAEIISTSHEGSGVTVHLQSLSDPYLYAEIFHVDLDPALSAGSVLNGGDQLGTHFAYNGDGGNSDIAVWVRRPDGYRLVTQFEIMSASVLNEFTARGVSDWTAELYFEDDPVANPHLGAGGLQCSGEDFVSGTDAARDYFTLN